MLNYIDPLTRWKRMVKQEIAVIMCKVRGHYFVFAGASGEGAVYCCKRCGLGFTIPESDDWHRLDEGIRLLGYIDDQTV